MSISKTVKSRVLKALTEEYDTTEQNISARLHIARSTVHKALFKLYQEGKAECQSANQNVWNTAPWRKIVQPSRQVTFVPPAAKYEPILAPNTHMRITYDKLNEAEPFTLTAYELEKKLPSFIANIHSHLAALRNKGLVESKRIPGQTQLVWRTHPLENPMKVEHKRTLTAVPTKTETDTIDVIIDRILDDMVALKEAVQKMQAAAPSAEVLKLIHELTGKELSK